MATIVRDVMMTNLQSVDAGASIRQASALGDISAAPPNA